MLIDTQVLIWYMASDPRLSPKAAELLRTPGHYYSLASLWEAAIKSGSRKLNLIRNDERVSAQQFFDFVAERLKLTPLSISAGAIAAVEFLPPHHNDPFDRLLVAQALERDLELISADAIFDRYGARRIW